MSVRVTGDTWADLFAALLDLIEIIPTEEPLGYPRSIARSHAHRAIYVTAMKRIP